MNREIYQKRWGRAREKMREGDIAALLLVPSTDLYYLTGFRGHISDRFTGFLLTLEGAFFLYPAFEKNRINPELLDSAECLPHRDGEDPYGMFTGLLPRKDGIIASDTRIWGSVLLSLQERVPKARWLDAGKILIPLRIEKDEGEYGLLREAQGMAALGLEELYKWGLEGRSEKEAAAKLTEFCAQAGLEQADWGPIVASGPNGASPHHVSGDRLILPGDPVVIDFGGVHGGYQADMTRTPVIGKAGDEFKAVYETVLAANQAAFGAAKPGTPCEAVDTAARDLIGRAGYGEYFNHRLGHGIGLDLHEDPYMVKGNTRLIRPGMAFSDEPGIYLPGKFGVRIEDILFMGEKEAERLTPFPHQLREL
ncbi:MAG: Xaa-Pro peptidase family protein [Treponema sp.]|jgi:Xaa-Pro aminopeptidase|nr:Xaa-Pro peptidase family protein [Treponema sp.]